MSLLTVKELSKNFGGLAAVSSVSLTLEQGELAGLIGPNGAGKTTLFNLLTGVYEPTSGTIELEVSGTVTRLDQCKTHVISQMGLGRTFQNIRLFKNMTVLENVKIGMHKNVGYGLFSALLRLPKFYRIEQEVEAKAIELLRILQLDHKQQELARNLPYGEQRRLEIARALANDPILLFLDEPAAGMNPHETSELTQLIKRISKEFHVTILLIEHDMSLVMDVCEKIFVLDYGRLIAKGTPLEIKQNKKVIQAYLGEEI